MPNEWKPAGRVILPFGVESVTAANIAVVPQVAIDIAASTPLRLGDGPYRPAALAAEDIEPSHAAARLDVLRRLHLRDCGVFDKHLRRWLELYFDWVVAEADAAADALAARAATQGVAFDHRLWALAALRPLPRAQLPAGDARFIAVDAALWTGRELIAVLIAGGERAARFAAADLTGVRAVTVAPASLAGGPDVIAEQLGDAVCDYWGDLAAPPDPFSRTRFRGGLSGRPAF